MSLDYVSTKYVSFYSLYELNESYAKKGKVKTARKGWQGEERKNSEENIARKE